MPRTLISQTPELVGQQVAISGWIDARRDMGKIVFLDIRDRTGLLQVVCVPGVPVHTGAVHPPTPPLPAGGGEKKNNFSPSLREGEREGVGLKDLRPGFVLRIEGLIKARSEKAINPKLETGRIELEAKEIAVLATSQPFPFDATKELGLDTYLDHLPFALRTPRARAIFKVQAEIVEAFRAFLRSQGFTEFQCPKLVGSSTEGGAEVFTVDYFGKPAFLAQSPQFYKQIMLGVFERVFTVGNVYRAEPHATTRHLNEYTSLDLEMGFIEDHRDIMRVQNDLLIAMVAHLRATCGAYFLSPSSRGGVGGGEGANGTPLFNVVLPDVPLNIPSVKLREAQKILEKEFGIKCLGEPDLEPEHERKLCEWSAKTHNSDFLFVTHYPTKKRPMYTFPDPEDPEFTRSFDLLFRGVEITTGGQRINDYEMLRGNIIKWGLNPEKFKYYLEAFQYGMPPEGGLAIGLERLTAKFLGIDNVKEATLFPRDIGRIDERLSTN
ncbi:MAG: amino acid--tRNA ligase-related protein [Candidatus Uhrbacteria bacterium]